MNDNELNNTDIQALTQLNLSMSQPESSNIAKIRIEDPISAIESSFTKFVHDSFVQVQEDREFKDVIKDAIVTRLGEANIQQLMDFYKEVQTGESGAASILISPLIGLQSAKVHAEVESHQLIGSASSVSDDRLFKKASKDVLQGIVQLNQLLEAMNSTKNNTVTAEIIETKN